MRYTRSPASVLLDSICRLCFLAAVDKKPRTLCACQPVVFRISPSVAPWDRPINARIWAPLLSGRGETAGFARAAFVPAFVVLVAAALVLPPLGVSAAAARPV